MNGYYSAQQTYGGNSVNNSNGVRALQSNPMASTSTGMAVSSAPAASMASMSQLNNPSYLQNSRSLSMRPPYNSQTQYSTPVPNPLSQSLYAMQQQGQTPQTQAQQQQAAYLSQRSRTTHMPRRAPELSGAPHFRDILDQTTARDLAALRFSSNHDALGVVLDPHPTSHILARSLLERHRKKRRRIGLLTDLAISRVSLDPTPTTETDQEHQDEKPIIKKSLSERRQQLQDMRDKLEREIAESIEKSQLQIQEAVIRI